MINYNVIVRENGEKYPADIIDFFNNKLHEPAISYDILHDYLTSELIRYKNYWNANYRDISALDKCVHITNLVGYILKRKEFLKHKRNFRKSYPWIDENGRMSAELQLGNLFSFNIVPLPLREEIRHRYWGVNIPNGVVNSDYTLGHLLCYISFAKQDIGDRFIGYIGNRRYKTNCLDITLDKSNITNYWLPLFNKYPIPHFNMLYGGFTIKKYNSHGYELPITKPIHFVYIYVRADFLSDFKKEIIKISHDGKKYEFDGKCVKIV